MVKYLISALMLGTPLLSVAQWTTTYPNPTTTGKVGIGLSAGTIPNFDLVVSGSTNPYMLIHNSSYTYNPTSLTRKGGIIFQQGASDKTAGIQFAVPPGYHVPGILFSTKTVYNLPGTSSTDWYDRMYIHPEGNIGIGTTAPTTKLHIEGGAPGGNISLYVNGGGRFGGAATIGRSGGHYDEFGYNVGFTTSSDTYNYIATDAAASIRMGWGGGIEFRTAPNGTAGAALTLTNKMRLTGDGSLGIGTNNPDAKLTVNGDIHSKEVRVDLNIPVPDYVFEDNYNLPSLNEIEEYVKQNKHLPDVPSAKDFERTGLNLSEMNLILLRKIEELTLYLIEQNNRIAELEKGQNKECEEKRD